MPPTPTTIASYCITQGRGKWHAEVEEEPTRRRLLSALRTATSTSGRRGAGGEHPLEDLHRLLHLVHRPERDATVRLLERREIATDADLERGARLAELARRALQVDEDAVGVTIGSLEPQI